MEREVNSLMAEAEGRRFMAAIRRPFQKRAIPFDLLFGFFVGILKVLAFFLIHF